MHDAPDFRGAVAPQFKRSGGVGIPFSPGLHGFITAKKILEPHCAALAHEPDTGFPGLPVAAFHGPQEVFAHAGQQGFFFLIRQCLGTRAQALQQQGKILAGQLGDLSGGDAALDAGAKCLP